MATRSNDPIAMHADRPRLSAIMTGSFARCSLVGAAALLLPLMAGAGSILQTQARSGQFVATAQVDFKVIIPAVVSLSIGSGDDPRAASGTVSIMSSSRTVTLRATTIRTSDDEGSDTPPQTSTNSAAIPTPGSAVQRPASSDDAHGNVILNAARGKIIAQDERCMPGDTHAATAPADPNRTVNMNTTAVICTVSMP
jgi:hypothetical protein